MRYRPEANHGQSNKNAFQSKASRRSDQAGIFATAQIARQEYVRKLTDRYAARHAGLPDPETISGDYRELGDKDLPIYSKKRELITAVRNNRVTVIDAGTGTGKTSQIYQYMLGEGYDLTVVLVPRIVIAENVYEHAVDELTKQRSSEFAAKTLGVAHSERVVLDDDTKAMFMTAGTFVKMYPEIQRKYGEKPVAIIPDEIHEADLQVELATALAAQSVTENDNWRVILSSATHNLEKIQTTMTPVNEGKEIPVISVEGRPHPVVFIAEPDLTVIEAFLKYRRNDDDDQTLRERVLLFQSGKREIRERLDGVYDSMRELQKKGEGSTNEVIPMALHAKITKAAFEAIMKDVPEGRQMLVASTSAGQSGITIPRTSLVITDGLTKRSILDNEGTPGLMLMDASQDELVQQGGRAGRDIEGGLWILAQGKTETGDPYFRAFDEREPHAPAQIYNTNISRTVLTVAALNRDFSELNNYLLSPVDETTIVEAEEALFRLGALDENNLVTPLGIDMDKFPMRPEFSRGVVEAWRGNYTLQTIANVTAVACALEAGGFASFDEDAGLKWKDVLRELTDDDCIAQLDMFQATRKHFFGHTVDEEALVLQDFEPKNTYRAHRQWDKSIRAMGFSPIDIPLLPPTSEDEQDIKNLLLAGMIDYIYEKTGSAGRSNTPVYKSIYRQGEATERSISSRSLLEEAGSPQYIVGSPRRYPFVTRVREKLPGDSRPISRKKVEIKHIIENNWPLPSGSRAKLAQYATRLVSEEASQPRLDTSGRLIEIVERKVGTIVIDAYTQSASGEIPKEGKLLLVEQTLAQHSNDVQRVLKTLLFDLESICDLLPEEERSTYFQRTDIPNRATLRLWVEEASEGSHSVGEVNSRLRARLYQEGGLRRDSWISDEKLLEAQERSPKKIEGIGRKTFNLSYEAGRPIINRMKYDDISALPDPCLLADGREIGFRMDNDPDHYRGARIYTLQDIYTQRDSKS